MLDIVVPVYNEDKNIIPLFDEIQKEIKTPKKVLVVYDFDEDTTIPVVNEIKGNYSYDIIPVKNNVGRGVINAIKVGLSTADSEMILVMMADLSDRLDVVDEMCAKMESGYDVVCGSRYMKGGSQNGSPFLKGMMSRCAGLSLHLLTRIPTHDVTNSFKLYRNSMLRKFEMESTGGFEIGLEICVKAYLGGYKITEVPSQWFDRVDGESHFKLWEWLPHYLHWYFHCIRCTWFGKKKKSVE